MFVAIAAGLVVHPLAMWLTAALYLKHRENLTFTKVLKVSATMTCTTALALAAVWYFQDKLDSRGGMKAMIAALAFLPMGIWFNAKYMLEQEDVDEFTLTVHFVAIHVGLYFAASKLLPA